MRLPPQTSLAGTGAEPGPVITSEAAAAAVNQLFERCESDLRFAVGKPGPSYDDLKAIQTPLEALDRDRKCGKRQFLDRQGHKWSVKYDVGAQRASLVNEEARLESRSLQRPKFHTHSHLHVHDAHTTPAPATTSIEESALARPSFSRLKTRLVQTSDTKLPLAGDGSKPGPVIKSEAAAAALDELFRRCKSDLRFAVNKPGPSYDQALAIKASLEALDRDRKCSGMQFLDREGHKWSVTYNHSNKKVSVVDEGVRAESRTALSKTRTHPASRIFYASHLHNINQ